MGGRGECNLLRHRHISCQREGRGTFPNGDRVAWFLDPDGNILSLTQLAEDR